MRTTTTVSTTTVTPATTTKDPKDWHDEIAFVQDGFVDLDNKLVSHAEDKRVEVTMRLATRLENGLVLFQGEEDGSSWYSSNHYIALGGMYNYCPCWAFLETYLS